MSDAIIRPILRRHFGDKVRYGWRNISPAISNQVFAVTVHGAESVIIKANGVPRGRSGFSKEAAALSFLKAAGVPVPSVLALGRVEAPAEVEYLLLERVAGEPVGNQVESLSPFEVSALCRELGQVLARIHSPTFPTFGSLDLAGPDLTSGTVIAGLSELPDVDIGDVQGLGWRAVHERIVERRVRNLVGTRFESVAREIGARLADAGGLLEMDVSPRFLHMDYHAGNVLMHKGKVTGVIDFESSIIGHTEYDLMRARIALSGLLGGRYWHEFVRGYETILKLDEGYDRRLIYYRLSRGLRGLNYFAEKEAFGRGDEAWVAAELRTLSRLLARLPR